MELVTPNRMEYAQADEDGLSRPSRTGTMPMHQPERIAPTGGGKSTLFGGAPRRDREPFKITFTGKGIDVSGRIETLEEANECLRAIDALKPLLRPISEIKRPENVDGDSLSEDGE
jgi:hypothetical protein